MNGHRPLRGTETGLQVYRLQDVHPRSGEKANGRVFLHFGSAERSLLTSYPKEVIRLWSRIHSSLDLGMRQQVTRLGLLFTMASVIVALGAFASANNLLFLILAIMLATFMVSGFISRLSLAGLELDFLLPEHISAGRKLFARIVIRNTKSWMPSFSIHVTASGDSGLSFPLYFPVIPGGARVEEPVELLFARRGSYRQNSFRFSTRFPFGFTERRINVPLLREVLIYPSDRSAARLRGSAALARRRDRVLLPRPGSRLLPHSPLRSAGERAARGLEGYRPYRRPPGSRIRP